MKQRTVPSGPTPASSASTQAASPSSDQGTIGNSAEQDGLGIGSDPGMDTPMLDSAQSGLGFGEESFSEVSAGGPKNNVWAGKATPQDVWSTLLYMPRYRKIIKSASSGLYMSLKHFVSPSLSDDKFLYDSQVMTNWGARKEADLKWSSFTDRATDITNVHIQNRYALDDLCTEMVSLDKGINKGFDKLTNAKRAHSPGAQHALDYLARQNTISIAYHYGMSKG
ncbi:MAG: hypothetical protein JRJ84_14205 [Deltaproteobacteria bacterium]|nr:hypothetical protein [Deltaproteobacteria bacterium]